MVHKYISRWAYESAIPFHAFERDSFKMMLEVVGRFGTGIPPPTRYALSDTLLKHELVGGTTPHLTKIAMMILSLTSSSSGCERNWSTFEGVHTKKRNRLEASKLNNLVYVQFNVNLIEKNQKRKDRNMEVLLANHSLSAQEWIVDVDEVDPETVNEDLGIDDNQAPRESPRTRELSDEDFESERRSKC
ncbi:unnamed protein product [Lactuca virosa]|uniref:HAT C-terminal dimerisation domain-containing protein n=1 Tax=Lactuca virosa TaxID=75947 RepID=A0AAU9NNZ9_9ASTR|nr:unnamed protein product [Lactuca virosa]